MIDLLTFSGALAFGSLAFIGTWIAIVIATLVLIGLTEKQHWFWATTLFVAGFVALGAAGIFDIIKYASTDPWGVTIRVGMYILIGCFWGAIKWWFYCRKQRKLYDKARAEFLATKNVSTMTDELRVEWTQHLQSYRYSYSVTGVPQASENKERIMTWMYLWPFSMLGTLVSEFLFKIWDRIYDAMGEVYNSIAASAFSGVESDFASKEELAAAKKKKEEDAQQHDFSMRRR